MSEKKDEEIYYRSQAFKFFDKGKSNKEILRKIPRSPSWLFKWKQRFQTEGWSSLHGLLKTPKHCHQAYPTKVRTLVYRVRKRLETGSVSLVGARAIFFELKGKKLVNAIPSISTIKRWLKEGGFCSKETEKQRQEYYPAFLFEEEIFIASMDWIARYIRGGEKIFVFHTIDFKTHALCQSIHTDKSADVACAHLLLSMKKLGLMDFLQVDNDAAFTGLGRKARIFGRFVRVALYFGVELVFIAPREPKRNSLVERVNGLWARAFWEKNEFTSLKEVRGKSVKFLTWYLDYHPPGLSGKSVREAASARFQRRKLSEEEIVKLPASLPLTEGRIHYIRRVDNEGFIEILKERFKISKTVCSEYVTATIDVKEQSLTIYYRRSAKSKAKIIRKFDYKIEEKIEKLQSSYRRERRRKVDILQII